MAPPAGHLPAGHLPAGPAVGRFETAGGDGGSATNDRTPALTRRTARLLLLPAAVVLFHLAGSLAPAEPPLLGVPLGLALQLGIAAASTVSLWLLARTLLPEREAPPPEGSCETDPGTHAAAPEPPSSGSAPGGRS